MVNGNQAYEHARIDEEIFQKLHHSSVVLADITGMRPNCFIELGYALGRCLPTMLLAKRGNEHPFDIVSFSRLHWKTTGTPAGTETPPVPTRTPSRTGHRSWLPTR